MSNTPRMLGDVLYADYPVRQSVRFFSSSNPSEYLRSNTFVENSAEGFYDEMEKIGIQRQSIDEIPDELVPISDLSVLYRARKQAGVVLDTIRFAVFDVKRTEATLGTSIQNSTVLAAITASLGYDNNIYVQSSGLNAIPVEWQPNWFRPRVVINGRDVFGNIDKTHHPNHAGLASIGSVATDEARYAIHFDAINEIKVNARCAQRILAGSEVWYQPYAVFCEITFRLHW